MANRPEEQGLSKQVHFILVATGPNLFVLQVEGMEITIGDLVGSTGLELKVDPGIPYVYAGFAGRPKLAWALLSRFAQSPNQADPGLADLARKSRPLLYRTGKVGVKRQSTSAFLFMASFEGSLRAKKGTKISNTQPRLTGVADSIAHAGLMITTAISYLSHSQIWALQEGSWLHVSGKTNRAKAAFEQEMARLVEDIPDTA